MFQIGQKVVCVDVSIKKRGRIPVTQHIKKNGIYTIRAVGRDTVYFESEEQMVWLQEVRRSNYTHEDAPFHAARFRPLVEKKTDISIFKKMLIPSANELV